MRVMLIMLLGLIQQPDSASIQIQTVDSLYAAHDTAGLVTTLKSWLRSLDATADSAAASATTGIDSAATERTLDAITSPQTPPTAPEQIQQIPGQVRFIALLLALFLIPKILQRYRIPGAVTSLL